MDRKAPPIDRARATIDSGSSIWNRRARLSDCFVSAWRRFWGSTVGTWQGLMLQTLASQVKSTDGPNPWLASPIRFELPKANPLCVHTILRRLPLARADRLTRRLMFCFPHQQGFRLMPPRHRLLRLLLPGLAPAAALLTLVLLLCLGARGLAGPISTLFLTPFSAPLSTGATAFGLPLPAPPPASTSTILPPPLHLAARAGRQHARAALLAFRSKRHSGSRNMMRMMMQGSSAASSSSSSAGE